MTTDQKQSKSVDYAKELVIGELISLFEIPRTERDDKDKEDIRTANSTLGGISRILATERVSDATQFNVIRMIATDTKTREEYIKATLPQYIPSKLLEKTGK
jgi:hypothetical protein